MKRLITVLALFVPLLATVILLYSFVPGFSGIPYVGAAVKQVKNYIGVKVLFKRKHGLHERPVVYRYYANGRWQQWEELQLMLFNEYCKTGHFGALKHSRLDGAMADGVYAIAKGKSVEKVKKSASYTILKQHLITFHSNNTLPDSVEFSFYSPHTVQSERELILTFKDRP